MATLGSVYNMLNPIDGDGARLMFLLAGNQLYDWSTHRGGWCWQKKIIANFAYNQWVYSLDMKTKVDQHVPRINLSHFNFWILNLNFQISNFDFFYFPGSQLLSDFQTFLYLCHMSHVTFHMSYVKCLFWSLGHAQQLLFSCLCSKVAVSRWKWQWFFLDSLLTLTC